MGKAIDENMKKLVMDNFLPNRNWNVGVIISAVYIQFS
jgi:hypothetical protein